jgi:transglutaminase-like putative cysteine protease
MVFMRFSKYILSVLFAVCFFVFAFSRVSADENFDISLSSTYIIQDTGNTTVQQQFELVNKKPTLYAKQYALEIGATKLRNVKVFDEKGSIPANVVTSANKTSIGITFDDKVVGEGKKRSFTIQFDTADTALVSGNVLEVYIPKLSTSSTYNKYQVVLKVPLKFGSPARVTPAHYAVQQTGVYTILNFGELGNQSVSALFGEKQIFEFTLRYNLENPTGSAGVIQIALPPDTEYQKMYYHSLDPSPVHVERDEDGNWIATYEIAAEKDVDVYLTGQATVQLEPQADFPVSPPPKDLLVSQKYWETHDPKISELAQKYKTPRDIYTHVVNTLTYNYNKINSAQVERLGALGAVAQPDNAACQEFTDLFIAIARAAGIPARRATGYAYTANDKLRPLELVSDVLHAWPEYFDSTTQKWVPVDPTWGNTTGGVNYFDQFDFNHLVFTINGHSSTLPYGAGAYKRENQETKDVEVKFSKTLRSVKPNVEVTVRKKLFFGLPLTNQYIVSIKNNSGVASYNVPVELSSSHPDVSILPQASTLEYMLPFQTQELTFTAKPKNWFSSLPFTLTARVQGISSSHEFTTGLFTRQTLNQPIFAIGVGGCVVLLAIITGSVLVLRRKR